MDLACVQINEKLLLFSSSITSVAVKIGTEMNGVTYIAERSNLQETEMS